MKWAGMVKKPGRLEEVEKGVDLTKRTEGVENCQVSALEPLRCVAGSEMLKIQDLALFGYHNWSWSVVA
jgi:hypothetical protein